MNTVPNTATINALIDDLSSRINTLQTNPNIPTDRKQSLINDFRSRMDRAVRDNQERIARYTRECENNLRSLLDDFERRSSDLVRDVT